MHAMNANGSNHSCCSDSVLTCGLLMSHQISLPSDDEDLQGTCIEPAHMV